MAIQHSNEARNWKEGRRIRAWELRQEGWKQRDIAKALGVTEGAVSQWFKRANDGGVEALLSRKALGPPPKLTSEQRDQLPEILQSPPKSYGFDADSWTCKQVAAVIEQKFGVCYHPSHVSRLMRNINPKKRNVH